MQSSEDGTHSLWSFCPLMRKGPLRPACKDQYSADSPLRRGGGWAGGGSFAKRIRPWAARGDITTMRHELGLCVLPPCLGH
jgi:hypothetical protein